MNLNHRLFVLIAVCFMASNTVMGQLSGTGKPIAEVFTNFHTTVDSPKPAGTTGFEVNRAFIGYSYTLDNNFSATIIADAAGLFPQGKINGSSNRYAYLREASMAWQNDKVKVTFGVSDTRLYLHQSRWWGKRYLANTMQSAYGYGHVNDFGIAVDYKFNDVFSGDITVMNGEGYTELQRDNNVRSSIGLTANPSQNLTFRVYGDHYRVPGNDQFVGVAFAGYKHERFYIGIDGSYKSNIDGISGHNSWGLSTTNGVYITEKDELFVRYDYHTSVNHISNDGDFTMAGIQHTFSPNMRIALSYQGTNPYSNSTVNSNMIFLNAHFKF
ncbi:MAG: hypothetical protein LBV26_06695 [Bacteroidales bacterium]|jgi:hypothetical protein|nr:hypothetical protein [Bacteroidales bacterium]